jgi:tetratricopeptide (TPR) repeat protein/predicted Ser/Thr protein kinase
MEKLRPASPGSSSFRSVFMSSLDGRLGALLRRWTELHEQGQLVSVEDLCHDTPELTEDLRRRINALQATGLPDEELTNGASPGTLAPSPPGCRSPGPTTTESEDAADPGQPTQASLHTMAVAPELPADWSWDTADTTAAQMRIPGYEILKELGRGGMGVVYLARQKGLDRLVALKMIISGDHASTQQSQRFHSEAQAISRLRHSNLVQIYEVGEHEGRPFFSLEFVDGGTLQDKLRRTPQPSRESAQLVETLARAIHSVHEQGIVHRDLKPANVLLMKDGTPKITDFGLAKRLDGGGGQTRTGAVMGTPAYMAPEQASGRIRDIGPHTDVYALGAMLYEFLTGRPPFLATTDWETILQVVEREPVPPSSLQPKVPRDLETICLKCLHKDWKRRYTSAAELADDVHRFLKDEPIRARPVGPGERAWKWARKRPTLAGLLLVSVLAVLSLAAYQNQAWRQEELERRHHSEARTEVSLLLSRANQAASGDAWTEAQTLLRSAEDRLKSEPGLTESRVEVEHSLAKVEGRLAAVNVLQQFQKARDDALFQATLSAGDPSPPKVKLTIEKTRTALARVGLTESSNLVLGPAYRSAEIELIKTHCYELLLTLAEALAQPLPDQAASDRQQQARRALAVLDQAAALGLHTRAWHLRRARYLEQAGDAAAAKAERVLAAKQSPSGALDYYLVGVELYAQQDAADETIRAFEEVLRLEPNHFWARYFLAISYVRLDQPALAKANLTACLAQRADVIWVYLLRGFAEGQLGEFQEAEEDFQAALERKPDDEARYVLFNNRGVMRIGQKKFAEGVADLEQAVRLRPEQYQAYASLGEACRLQKKLDEARTVIDKALSVAAEQVKKNDVPPETLALLYHNRARVNVERKDTDTALQDLKNALAHEPAGSPVRARTHVERGRLLHAARRDAEALAEFEAALKVQPDVAETYRWRAETLLTLKRYEDAVKAFNRYEEAGGPPVAQVYRERGLTWALLRKSGRAIDDFTRALELEPDDAATYAYRGQEFLAANFPRLALNDFNDVVRLKPEDLDGYTGRGTARARLGQHALAAADANELVRRRPNDAPTLCNASRILAQAVRHLDGDPAPDPPALAAKVRYQDRALDLLRKALDQLPGDEQPGFWQRNIRPDAAFDGLRRARGFVVLDRSFPVTSK